MAFEFDINESKARAAGYTLQTNATSLDVLLNGKKIHNMRGIDKHRTLQNIKVHKSAWKWCVEHMKGFKNYV